MKTKLLCFILLLAVIPVLGQVTPQAPQKFSYQAVLRNADGTVIGNQSVEVQVKLHAQAADGAVVYTQTQTVETNQFGLVAFAVGGSSGFETIPWTDPIFMEILVKRSGESSFSSMGTTQIISVPYALVANNGIQGPYIQGQTVFSNGGGWVGTNRVMVADSSVVVTTPLGHDSSKPIFAVTNANGEMVMAVYESGVRFYVEEETTKGVKGGFAVGGLTNQVKETKSGEPIYYMNIQPTQVQFLIEEPTEKGVKGGFAVGGLTNQTKGTTAGDTVNYMSIQPTQVQFLVVEPAVKGVKGGFAVGGLTNQGKTLTPTENYFEVNRDSAQFLTPSLVSQGNITTQGNITVSGNITTNVGQADSTLTDFDGNTYQTVRIGFQQWMAENLKTTHYSDGTPIDTAVHVYNDWAYPDSINIYGRLYSGLAISSGNNVCPDGWHVPTPDDWNELFTFIAGPAGISDMQSRVLVLKKLLEPGTMMEGNGYWNYPIYPTNETGFTARPAGQRDYLTYYSELHDYANFWSYVVGVGLQQVSMTTMDGGNLEIMPPSDPNYSFSVRCLQNP